MHYNNKSVLFFLNEWKIELNLVDSLAYWLQRRVKNIVFVTESPTLIPDRIMKLLSVAVWNGLDVAIVSKPTSIFCSQLALHVLPEKTKEVTIASNETQRKIVLHESTTNLLGALLKKDKSTLMRNHYQLVVKDAKSEITRYDTVYKLLLAYSQICINFGVASPKRKIY